MDMTNFPAGLRVLAIDDDRVSLMILEKQLKHCNYNVTTVVDAKKALDILRERKGGDQFNLVICDVFMPDIDGFKLLELIGQEMDMPVIMLSANNEIETMKKGIQYGACDYFVKPVRLEQLRGIWAHVVRNGKNDPRNSIRNGNDCASQKLRSGDGDKGEKDGTNHTNKYPEKKKNGVDTVYEEKEKTSTQKRQRVKWPGELHHKFVEAVNKIGIDRAAPNKILEVMNVDGITREKVSSHLQKYHMKLRKLSEDILKSSKQFVEGPKARQSDQVPANSNENVPESSSLRPELGRYQLAPSSVASPRSSNLFARMNSPSAFGTHFCLPNRSIQIKSPQRNWGIPEQDMEVGHGVNLPEGSVPVPVHDVSTFISSGDSFVPISSGGPSVASQCFPSSPSGSFFANITNGVVFNTSKHLCLDISSTSFANISNDSSSQATSMRSSMSILRSKILGASRGIPFEDTADGEMLAPSSYLPLQSPELVNQPPVEIQSSVDDLSNQVAREAHQFAGPVNSSNFWKVVVPSRFPDLSDEVGMSKGPSKGNIIKINQLARLAASSGQNQIAGIIEKTAPMVGFSEQVAPFSFGSNNQYTTMPIGNSDLGSSSSTRPALPNLEIDNSAMPSQKLNGGGANGNLPEGGTINHKAVGDQVINSNEFLMGTSEVENGASGALAEFFADWVNEEDFVNNNGGAVFSGDWDFAP